MLVTSPLKSLPESAIDRIDTFVKGGGILWAQGASTVDWLRSAGLTRAMWRRTAAEKDRDELARKLEDEKEKTDTAALEALLPARRSFADAQDEAAFRLVRGAILAGSVDTTHPLGYGYSDEFLPVFRRSARFMARSENAYSTPVLYADQPLLSGYMSEENRALAAASAGLIVDARGEGAVVLSLDSVSFRAFWWGTQKLLINAVFFGDLLEEPR
jgi:hypothetical protein